MPDKVIFLDIDGPMIPNTSFLFNRHASFDQDLDERCVGVLHKIIEKSGAKIVFNTTHSTSLRPNGISPGLLSQFKKAGFEKHIHPKCATSYPNVPGESLIVHETDNRRLAAIMDWLEEHRTDQMLWIALDDAPIPHKRSFLVNPDYGIGLPEYNHASNYLHFKDFVVL